MMMKRMVGVAAASAAGVVMVALAGAGPAWAQEPSAEVDPGTVSVGGDFEILVDCGEGSDGASVSATTLGGSSNVVMEQVEDNPGVFFTGLTVPQGTAPGSYELGGTCSDGSGWTVNVTVAPSGAPATGVASSDDGVDPALVALGTAGMLGAVAGGGWLIHRRRAETSDL